MSLQPNWSSLPEFLAMGGYGVYVWGSFGMTALVVLIELVSLVARQKAARIQTDGPSSTDEGGFK
ncbi:MAG: heme exporter protein CcmD [Polaromonas sp.]|nr:heme exporter protein CcmD [Polaromonas sp.]